MNRDLTIILLLLFFPIGTGAFYLALAWLAYQLRCQPCPHCEKRIPNDAVREGVPCPECLVPLDGNSLATPRREERHTCHRCGTEHLCWILWDNQPYCMDCLASASPDLLTAAASPCLSEAMSTSGRPFARAMAGTMLMFFAVISAVIIIFLLLAGEPLSTALWPILFVLLLGWPVASSFTWAAARAPRWTRLRVTVWQGLLIIRFGTQITVMPLTGCTWKDGRISQMTCWHPPPWSKSPVLLIDPPYRIKGVGETVAVGFTDKTRHLWQAFFQLTGIPKAQF